MRYPIFNPQHSWGVSFVASLFFYIRDLLQEAFFFHKSNLPCLPSVTFLSVSVLVIISVLRNSKLEPSP